MQSSTCLIILLFTILINPLHSCSTTPKAGLNFQLNTKNSFYGYFGIANKEPRRDDYESGAIKPERLFDYELGWKYNTQKVRLSANAFYMRYNDQLVLTGDLNDVGAPIFTNRGKRYYRDEIMNRSFG